MTVRIVVDAMGGDNAPQEIVAGALMASGGLDVELILVGRAELIQAELEGTSTHGLRIVDAPDVIEMEEHATDAVRAKPNASINVGLRLVKAGEADAFVTAGNTGATMTSALLTLGRVKGISRPALAILFPGADGKVSMMLDVGANADCRPIQLQQFAYMGAAYMQRMFNNPNPSVGLLSIGEEDSKGSAAVIETNAALRAGRLNFVGNLEGRDLTQAGADIAVMDGFTGNVVIKLAEGMAELMFTELRKAVELTLEPRRRPRPHVGTAQGEAPARLHGVRRRAAPRRRRCHRHRPRPLQRPRRLQRHPRRPRRRPERRPRRHPRSSQRNPSPHPRPNGTPTPIQDLDDDG